MPRPKRARPEPDVLLEAAKAFTRHEEYRDIAKRVKETPRNARWLLEQSMEWLLEQQARLARIERVETIQDRLEEKLLLKFPHLKQVQIVAAGRPKNGAQYAALVKQWGILGAEQVELLAENAARIETDLHIGLSGGGTILEVASNLIDRDRPGVNFHALAFVGHGQLNNTFYVGPGTNVTVAWARSGRNRGTCHYATVPPYDAELLNYTPDARRAEIAEDLKELGRQVAIRRVIAGMADLDVAFVGLGLVDPETANVRFADHNEERFTMTGLLKPIGIEPSELTSEGAVGDLGCCLFNADGEEQPRDKRGKKLPPERWRFFLTAGHNSGNSGLQYYRQMVKDHKKVVVIAGAGKEPAIRAALKGELFNHWITDDVTARMMAESD